MAKRTKVRKLKTYIEGTDEVAKLMQNLGDAASFAVDSAAKAGADLVLDDAKRRVPVDTGKLKASLILKKSKTKNPNIKSEYYVTKESGAEHFAPVELGTSKMKAQPFLRPAVDENKDQIAQTVNDVLLQAIGRIK